MKKTTKISFTVLYKLPVAVDTTETWSRDIFPQEKLNDALCKMINRD